MTALHLSKLTTERLLALFSSEILPTNRRSHPVIAGAIKQLQAQIEELQGLTSKDDF